MRARSIAVLGPAYFAFAVSIATIAALGVPLRAQQAHTPAVSAAILPAEVQPSPTVSGIKLKKKIPAKTSPTCDLGTRAR